jgi:hypothetical protein
VADTAIALPPSGTGIAGANLVVDEDGAGNYIPTSKLTTGAAGVNGGFVTPTNPLPVGGADLSGNPQVGNLRLVNGIWQYLTSDEINRAANERAAHALESMLGTQQFAPLGDIADPLSVRLAPPAPGVLQSPLALGYAQAGIQTIACTFAGLTNNSQRQSQAVYTGALGFRDILIWISFKTAASATSATGIVNVYGAGSYDGQHFGDTVTGTNAAVTLTAPPNIGVLGNGTINAVANSTVYNSNAMSLAAAFNGTLPPYWSIVIENKTGATLLAAGPTFARWLGVY